MNLGDEYYFVSAFCGQMFCFSFDQRLLLFCVQMNKKRIQLFLETDLIGIYYVMKYLTKENGLCRLFIDTKNVFLFFFQNIFAQYEFFYAIVKWMGVIKPNPMNVKCCLFSWCLYDFFDIVKVVRIRNLIIACIDQSRYSHCDATNYLLCDNISWWKLLNGEHFTIS